MALSMNWAMSMHHLRVDLLHQPAALSHLQACQHAAFFKRLSHVAVHQPQCMQLLAVQLYILVHGTALPRVNTPMLEMQSNTSSNNSA